MEQNEQKTKIWNSLFNKIAYRFDCELIMVFKGKRRRRNETQKNKTPKRIITQDMWRAKCKNKMKNTSSESAFCSCVFYFLLITNDHILALH